MHSRYKIMKLSALLLLLAFGNTSASLVTDVRCSAIDYWYQDANCCSSGANVGRCLKQIAQADLDAELLSLNTKIDNLQYGGMTVQQSAVLSIGASSSSGTANKEGTLRVQGDGSIEVMANGKIDIKNDAVLDVSGATVTGLGGSASSDAVSIGYMTLVGIVGDAEVSGELSVNGGLRMDNDKLVVEDNTGAISTKGSLSVASSIDASSLAIDSDKLTVDVLGNLENKGTITSSGDLKLKHGNDVTVTLDSITGSMTINGFSHVKGKLYLDDEAILNKGLNIKNKFMVEPVTGDTTIVGSISVAGLTSANGGLDIGGASRVKAGSTLKVHGVLDVSDGTLIGAATQLGTVSIQKLNSTLDHNHQASNNVNLASGKMNSVVIGAETPAAAEFLLTKVTDLEASGSVTAASLDVSGAAALGATTITGDLDGVAKITATGAVTAGSFVSLGDLEINKIVATGVADLDAGIAVDDDKFTVSAEGNVVAKGKLEVEGKTSSAGLDIVGESLQIAETDIAADLKVSIAHDTGNIMTEGDLLVKQKSTMEGHLIIGETNSTAGLSVSGSSALDGGVKVGSVAEIDTTGKISISDGIYAQKSSSLKGLVVQKDGDQGLTVDGVVSKLDGGIKVKKSFNVSEDGSMDVAGSSNFKGGLLVNDKFSVNEQGHVTAVGLTVAGSRLPEIQEAEDVDCSGFVDDGSVSGATAGDGKVIILMNGTCAKRFEKYSCGSDLQDPNSDDVISEAEFLNHETSRICSGVFTVSLVDSCKTIINCQTTDNCGANVGGVYCRPLDTRAKCEGNNLFGDSDDDATSDQLRAPQAWTTLGLLMKMCTSTTTYV